MAASPGSSPAHIGGSSTVRLGGPQLRDLQVQLSEEKAKVTSLQANLEESRKSTQELMNVTKQQEKQLKDSSESYKLTQEQLVFIIVVGIIIIMFFINDKYFITENVMHIGRTIIILQREVHCL